LAESSAGWQYAQGYLVGRVCIAAHSWSATCPILTTASFHGSVHRLNLLSQYLQ